MDLKNLGKSLTTFAPAIGAAIGGPVGAVAGMGVKFLASFFGLGEEETNPEKNPGIVEKLLGAVNGMTYEQALALKEKDNDFKVKMEELGIKVFELEVEDRKSARDMAKTTGIKPQVVIACIVNGAFLTMCGFVLYRAFTGQGVSLGETLALIVGNVMGYLNAKAEQTLAFFFGTTKSSQEKTQLLYQSTPPKQQS